MFSFDGFRILLFSSMRIPNIYGIIRLLWNLMFFPLFNVFKHLLSVSFLLKLNLFKLIEAVNVVN
jgi:hypothetical protein